MFLKIGPALAAGLVVALNPGARGEPSDSKEISFANPETAILELYVGPWAVAETHYNPRGDVVATVKGSEEIKWVLDERAVQRTYITSSASNVYRAMSLLAWDDVQKSYRGIWLDNASTKGPSSLVGRWQPESQTMIFTVNAQNADGSKAEFKIVERFVDPETRAATTYRVDDKGVVKLLEVEYKRTTPCPGRLRIIFDGLSDGPRG